MKVSQSLAVPSSLPLVNYTNQIFQIKYISNWRTNHSTSLCQRLHCSLERHFRPFQTYLKCLRGYSGRPFSGFRCIKGWGFPLERKSQALPIYMRVLRYSFPSHSKSSKTKSLVVDLGSPSLLFLSTPDYTEKKSLLSKNKQPAGGVGQTNGNR